MKLKYDAKWKHLNVRQERSFDYIENVKEEQGKSFIKWFDTYMCKPKYKKAIFKISVPNGYEDISGYRICGTDYVVHKTWGVKAPNCWSVTHYPTGLLIGSPGGSRQNIIDNCVRQFYKIFVNPEITHKCKIINQ